MTYDKQFRVDSTAARPAPERVRIGSPGELIAAVPYLLGFVPVDSLVVVVLGGSRHEVVLVQRGDLAGLTPRVQAQLAGAARQSGGDSAAVILFGDVGEQAVAWSVGSRLEAAGIRLLDVLQVRDRRWTSLLCDDPTCCPPEGRPLPEVGTTVGEATLAYLGLTVEPGRDQVADRLAPDPPERRAAVRAELDRVPDGSPSDGLDLVRAAIRRAPDGPVSPVLAAQCLAAIADFRVRDCLLDTSVRADADAAARLWAELTRCAPDGSVAPAAVLVAAAAYVAGEGVLAAVALERAQSDDPDHVLAAQLSMLLANGFPPADIRRVLVRSARESRRRLRGVGAGRRSS
jgi:hypothetical protein